ncbi:MAG: AraC family transcriptional regulator [Acidobacteria bacterium]|nr:AraC family transcriptional regulator [Acidobacteriota bacterium]
MLYLSYRPRAPLNEFVERMWLVSGGQSARRERILPSGTIELVINLRQDQVRIDKTMHRAHVQTFSGAVVSGTYSAAFVIDAMQHAAMMGVHFRPAGAFAVLGVPSAEFSDVHLDVAALCGDAAARELRERLGTATTPRARFEYLERVLIERLPTNRRLHPVVSFALECFGPYGSGASVRDVARRSGFSHRRFLTVFKSEVGLPPKEFCRILRFQHVHAVAQRTGRINWTERALTCGFYDQPHLTNEFRRLSGLTPTQYERAIQDPRNLLSGHVAIP